MKYGARNSLLMAPMPTASTAQIMSNNESFEPYTTNIYTRRVLSGEFICVNPHLVRDMIKLGIWDNESRNQLVADHGSVQNLKRLPDRMK
jgi:ribonucleotide reductase alpha subunit